MSKDIPQGVIDAVEEIHRDFHVQLEAKLREVLHEVSADQLELFSRLTLEHTELFWEFLREGTSKRVEAHLHEVIDKAASTGISSDSYIQILLEGQSMQRRMLVERMPCDPVDLHKYFIKLDQYQRILISEFTKAHTDYWVSREKEAARLHTDFFSNLPFPAITGTSDLTIEDVNQSGIECLPLHREQLIGRTMRDWLEMVQVQPPEIDRMMKQLEKFGSLIQEGVRIICPTTGRTLHLLLSINFVRDRNDNPSRFQAVIQDITPMKFMEDMLAREMAKISAVFYSSPAGLIFVDPNRVVQRINHEASRILRYPPPEQIENGDMEWFREKVKHNYKDPEGFTNLLAEVYSDPNSTSEGELELVRPTRQVWYSVNPVRDASDAPLGWLWIFLDVTEEHATQQLRSDLTRMIVHDLKNPLTAIKGALHIFSRFGDDPHMDQALAIMNRNCDRMMKMIMNMLDIDRLESGKLELESATITVGELLTTVVESQHHAATNRDLVIDIDESTDCQCVSLDVNLIERVLTNLLSNAIKHTREDGQIILSASIVEDGELAISVKDNGAGIPKEFHEVIFEKFGQAKLRNEGHKTDTGLGLTFCKLAVEAHKGRISVDSEVGKGSTFTITLPKTVFAAPVLDSSAPVGE